MEDDEEFNMLSLFGIDEEDLADLFEDDDDEYCEDEKFTKKVDYQDE